MSSRCASQRSRTRQGHGGLACRNRRERQIQAGSAKGSENREGQFVRVTRVEGVVVSAQSVQRCLCRKGLLLDDGIRRPLWGDVSSSGGPPSGTFSRATKPARSPYEYCRLVLEDDFSRVLVLGHHTGSNSSSLALVEHLNYLGLVDKRSTSGDRTLDREVLLAMK